MNNKEPKEYSNKNLMNKLDKVYSHYFISDEKLKNMVKDRFEKLGV